MIAEFCNWSESRPPGDWTVSIPRRLSHHFGVLQKWRKGSLSADEGKVFREA